MAVQATKIMEETRNLLDFQELKISPENDNDCILCESDINTGLSTSIVDPQNMKFGLGSKMVHVKRH